MAQPSAQTWIQDLQLLAHAEGGFYSEVYRSPISFSADQLPQSFNGPRQACTHIYFLLTRDSFSAFHRIRSDELWHFYSGHPLVIYEIQADGQLKEHLLGNDPTLGQSLFTVIRAGNWFASRCVGDGEFGLAGCTVAPGFDFADFEMAERESLIQLYPQHTAIIEAMTR